jgi:two-component system response regulator YesN
MLNKDLEDGSVPAGKPTIVWFEQLAGSGGSEIPLLVSRTFSVKSITSETYLEQYLSHDEVAGVVFDFDYPDRQRLSVFAETKREHASVPMIVLSLQHSESLVKWAFRAGAMDFLVKPIILGELEACVERLVGISTMKSSQRGRLSRRSDSPIPSEVPHTVRSKKNRLDPAVHYVQQHYNEHIISDAMARICGMSASSFSSAFSKSYGVTFQEFLLRYRVKRACAQLKSPDKLQISDIAYSVGFSDPSYFTRVFRRYIGVTPSEFADLKATAASSSPDDTVEDPLSSSQVVRAISAPFDT